MSWYEQQKARATRIGYRGHPVGTLAFYGPDDQRATKVVAAVIRREPDESPATMQKWLATHDLDVRFDRLIGKQVHRFFVENPVRSYVVTDGIIGCPHEEGVDYLEGTSCPECPFWEGRNRWASA